MPGSLCRLYVASLWCIRPYTQLRVREKIAFGLVLCMEKWKPLCFYSWLLIVWGILCYHLTYLPQLDYDRSGLDSGVFLFKKWKDNRKWNFVKTTAVYQLFFPESVAVF